MKSFEERANLRFPIKAPDGEMIPPKRQWRWGLSRVAKAAERGELHFSKDRNGKWVIATKQYLRDDDGQRETKFFSLIDDIYTQHATNEIVDIFGDARVFPFPKPSKLIEKLVQIATSADTNDIILDFMAGSGTTAHAVARLNYQDGGNRRFVLIQLPEATGRNDFRTIADVARERIRRVTKLQRNDLAQQGKIADGKPGFRAFKLAPSNICRWTGVEDKKAETYVAQLEAFTDTLVPGWKLENVIWEVALREGFGPTARIEKLAAPKSGSYWRVTDTEQDRAFTVCLDDKLTLESMRELGLSKDDLFVCRDLALDDTLAANLALQCRLKVI